MKTLLLSAALLASLVGITSLASSPQPKQDPIELAKGKKKDAGTEGVGGEMELAKGKKKDAGTEGVGGEMELAKGKKKDAGTEGSHIDMELAAN